MENMQFKQVKKEICNCKEEILCKIADFMQKLRFSANTEKCYAKVNVDSFFLKLSLKFFLMRCQVLRRSFSKTYLNEALICALPQIYTTHKTFFKFSTELQ